MSPDPNRVFELPMRRLVVQVTELERQPVRMLLQPIDIGVDARDEASEHALRIRPVRGPFAPDITAIEEQARRPVLFDEGRTKDFSQSAEAAPAPEVYLKQPVPGHDEALREEQVILAARVQMRNTPAIHQYLDRVLQ